MYLTDLVLEITRKCNMACEHCLRGDAQSINIDYKVIDKLLSEVDSISSVTFTGGEPTLNVPAIKYFLKQANKRHVSIGYFYVVTNGKIQSMPLMKALIDLFAYCEEKDYCGLEVSRDQYHEEGNDTPWYDALKFYHPDKRRSHYKSGTLIGEGRALLNGIGWREETIPKFDVEIDDDNITVNSMVYISSNGNVITSCDLAYERIDEEAKGNILTETLKEIITKNVETVHE